MRANSDNKDGIRLTSVLDNEVTIFGACKQPDTKLQDIKLRDLLANIKGGAYSKQVQGARAIDKQTDLEAYKAYKAEQMMCFTLSGTFTRRENISLVKHSGVMQIDFDDLGAELDNVKQKLIDDPYTLFCCVSPGGRGLKGGIVIDPTKHKESFTTARKYYKSKYGIELDKQVSAISNAFIVTHDPEIYINESAKQFDVVIPEPSREQPEKRVFADDPEPGTYAVKRIRKLISNIASASKGNRHGARLNNARTFGGLVAGGYCSKNDYWSEFISASDSVSDNGKTSPGELHTLEDGYNFGLQSPIRIESFRDDRYKYIAYNKWNFDIVNIDTGEVNEITLPFCFWNEIPPKKAGGAYSLDINEALLYDVLIKYGITRIKETDKSTEYIIVRLKDSILTKMTISDVRLFVSDLLDTLPEQITFHKTVQDLKRVFLKKLDLLISQSKIEFSIKPTKLTQAKDTANNSLVFFKNGFVEVTKDNIILKPYKELKGYIWQSQVIQRDFELLQNDDINKLFDFDFYVFTQRICTFRKSEPGGRVSLNIDDQRLTALQCCIGYLLHTHVTGGDNKAVILTEGNISDDDRAHGRTGKGLIAHAIEKIRNVPRIDGKRWNPDNQFCMSNVDIDTNVIWFDDVKPNFDFQYLYSAITEGQTVERKHKDPLVLGQENMKKILICSNTAIPGSSESDRARRIDMEILPYYNADFTPKMDFGKKDENGNLIEQKSFWDDWNQSEWSLFDNYMMFCLQLFFKHNRIIPKYDSDTLAYRQFQHTTNVEFVDFSTLLEPGKEYFLADKCAEYNEFAGRVKNAVDTRIFAKYIRAYCEYIGAEYKSETKRNDFGKSAKCFRIVKS